MSLLGTIGGLVPVVLRNFAFQEVAVKVGLGMSVLSVIFLALCLRGLREWHALLPRRPVGRVEAVPVPE